MKEGSGLCSTADVGSSKIMLARPLCPRAAYEAAYEEGGWISKLGAAVDDYLAQKLWREHCWQIDRLVEAEVDVAQRTGKSEFQNHV